MSYVDYAVNCNPERPTQSSIISLFLCGFSILLLRILIPKVFVASTSHHFQPVLQSQDTSFPNPSRSLSARLPNNSQPLTPQVSSFLITTAVFALCFRIEIYRLALGNRQCTISGIEVRTRPATISLCDADLKGVVAFTSCMV